MGFLGLTFPHLPSPNPRGCVSLQQSLPCNAMTCLGSGTSLFYIIIFMDLFVDGEVFPKCVFLEEPGGQEEEAGPGVGNDHRLSQRVLVLQGEAKHPKLFYSQGSAKGSAGESRGSASIFIQTSQESKGKSHISRHPQCKNLQLRI